MEIFLLAIFVVAVLYFLLKRNADGIKEEVDEIQINMEDPSTVPRHTNLGERSFLSEIAEIAKNPTVDLGQKWRYEPASDRQIERIDDIFSDVDFSAPKNLTKGQASDIIGLFEEPEDGELAILRFFKVTKPDELNQTECRIKIYKLLSDSANATAWEERPASIDQKAYIRYLGGTVPKNLKAKDADVSLVELTESNPQKAEDYEELRDAYDNLVDPDTRDLYDLKKFSWPQYLKAVEALAGQGRVVTKIIDDEDLVAENLVRLNPKLLKV